MIVYYGSKIWDYEIFFNFNFSKIIDGSVYQYDENDTLLKIDPLIDMDDDDHHQCYELQITDSFQQSIAQITTLQGKIFHRFPKNTLPSTPP